jgi:hypothetical protein
MAKKKRPAMLNVIRYISKSGVSMPQAGAYSNEEVVEYLSEIIDGGYKLFDTHYLGETKDPDAYGILYVLEKVVE